jgi:NAD(P)-dependent dehydrogenase (short-subunit alcohol dehydrogenase family)
VRSTARELAPFGITANVVVPGPTETPLTDQLWRDDPARRQRLVSIVPVGRVAVADEIASAIAFLASEQSGFITGSELVIDGGLTSIFRQLSSFPIGASTH